VPIVRATGGLADTIDDVDLHGSRGTGFVFAAYDSGELLQTLSRAVAHFQRRKDWRRIIKAGMSRDFSWQRSAVRYGELYQQAMSKP
jgi:starch synthase